MGKTEIILALLAIAFICGSSAAVNPAYRGDKLRDERKSIAVKRNDDTLPPEGTVPAFEDNVDGNPDPNAAGDAQLMSAGSAEDDDGSRSDDRSLESIEGSESRSKYDVASGPMMGDAKQSSQEQKNVKKSSQEAAKQKAQGLEKKKQAAKVDNAKAPLPPPLAEEAPNDDIHIMGRNGGRGLFKVAPYAALMVAFVAILLAQS